MWLVPIGKQCAEVAYTRNLYSVVDVADDGHAVIGNGLGELINTGVMVWWCNDVIV